MAETRKPLISGNWKMNHNHFEAIQTVQKLGYLLRGDDYDAVDVSVHPPFTDIRSVQTTIEGEKKIEIKLGAQNCHWQEKGAFTGEVAPPMLAKLGVELVIVGHSERRELFGETDEMVNDKAKAVFQWGMTPILCVGETIIERREGAAIEKVTRQVVAGLQGLEKEQVASMVIAYEPIWAIGTGETASSADAQSMCATIREAVRNQFGAGWAEKLRIQYGGSVNDSNIAELMAEPDIDGALVGGASLDPDRFARICQYREHGVAPRTSAATGSSAGGAAGATGAGAGSAGGAGPDAGAGGTSGEAGDGSVATAASVAPGAAVEAAAQWLLGAVVAHAEQAGEPLDDDDIAMLRTPLGETHDAETQERRRDLNNRVVPLVRAAIEDAKAKGAPCVELRKGLRIPTDWAVNYKMVVEGRQPWLVSATMQAALTRNLLGNERRDWRSK